MSLTSSQQRWQEWYAKNREHRLQYLRNYHDQNKAPEKAYRTRNRSRNRAACARYSKRHPEVFAALQSKRRARLRNAVVETVDYQQLLQRWGRVCYICNIDIQDDLSFDHIIPLARGGPHIEENLRPAHLSCNCAKGTRVVSFFESLASHS